MNTAPLTELEEYFFDLRGYIVLENALSPDEVERLNTTLDSINISERGGWHGWVHAHSFGGKDGINYQQIYEAGEPFEALIDHPSWIDKVKTCVGGKGTFDHHHGALFIDENFANLRGPGEAIGIHSGGHAGTKRTQFRYRGNQFHCGQINILMALRDIGPGDGATMVIPGSHKSNIRHPMFDKHRISEGNATSMDRVEGAVEVHLKAGDVLLFVDAICHGSAARVNPGERRIVIYRYGPSWGYFRHPYHPSPGLLERLTPERRAIVWPHQERLQPWKAKGAYTSTAGSP